jgi:hypothetical protein
VAAVVAAVSELLELEPQPASIEAATTPVSNTDTTFFFIISSCFWFCPRTAPAGFPCDESHDSNQRWSMFRNNS